MTARIALPDTTYHRLVDDLLHARDEYHVMELIGGVANVWPESALPDPEAGRPDQQIAATPELGDRVLEAATAPNKPTLPAADPIGHTPLVWPPARPRSVKRRTINPPWGTSR